MRKPNIPSILVNDVAWMDPGNKGGFSRSIVTETSGAPTTNLHTTPQEDMKIGVHRLPATIPIGQEADRYVVVLAKYPPNIKVVAPGRSKQVGTGKA